ncbi:YndM family protein [Neobacillus sp. SM06]|uniref:YndM family protein n=1 Tax=Neobacillus sp. SM06 TaxID=3422492 RepID=UPI003D2C320E
MRHLGILLVKFVSCLIAFSVGLDLFFNADVTDIVTFSLAVTIISYLIGDRILLPRIGQSNALVADFFLVYLSVWLFGSVLLPDGYLQIAWGSIISAVILTGAEAFVHWFLVNRLVADRDERRNHYQANPKLAYGVEMAEEVDPLEKKKE